MKRHHLQNALAVTYLLANPRASRAKCRPPPHETRRAYGDWVSSRVVPSSLSPNCGPSSPSTDTERGRGGVAVDGGLQSGARGGETGKKGVLGLAVTPKRATFNAR